MQTSSNDIWSFRTGQIWEVLWYQRNDAAVELTVLQSGKIHTLVYSTHSYFDLNYCISNKVEKHDHYYDVLPDLRGPGSVSI